MATLTNILSFSDTLLLSREECIDAVNDRFHIVVDAIKRCDSFFKVWTGVNWQNFHTLYTSNYELTLVVRQAVATLPDNYYLVVV